MQRIGSPGLFLSHIFFSLSLFIRELTGRGTFYSYNMLMAGEQCENLSEEIRINPENRRKTDIYIYMFYIHGESKLPHKSGIGGFLVKN